MGYIPENTNIAVIGGGNIGTQFACVCASKGYKVNVLSSRPELFDGILETVDEFGNVTTGRLNKVSSNMADVMDGCRLIIVAHPAFRFKEIADQMKPYIQKGMDICVIPGTGGAEFVFRECVEKGAVLSGLQRVPSVARLEKYGKRVRCEGLRSELFLASIPDGRAEGLSGFMSYIWEIPCFPLPNYLSVTLTPSNPILHTARLRVLFADYEEGRVYGRNPLFYGEWDDASSELLLKCDEELQNLIRILDKMDLRKVRSLKLHYESDMAEAMTRKLRSIKSPHDLASPMKQVEGGWIPDFQSRYFTADFPYGLAIIEEMAEILGCDAPNIKDTMNWYRRVTRDFSRFDLRNQGIHSIDDIYRMYEKKE